MLQSWPLFCYAVPNSSNCLILSEQLMLFDFVWHTWASFYISENRLNSPTTKDFVKKITMKLVYQYMAIFYIFFFQFEIIINVLVSSFCFIWIPMLWVHGHYTCLNPFTRQLLTKLYVRFWCLKTVSALKELNDEIHLHPVNFHNSYKYNTISRTGV